MPWIIILGRERYSSDLARGFEILFWFRVLLVAEFSKLI